MTDTINARIARDPRFQAIASRRNRLAWTLFAITMVLYFGLMLTATLAPAILGQPISAGGTTSIGWPLGAAVIIIPWLLTILYVNRANVDSRDMAEVVEEVTK
ncbi:DUF485 domain-containing protein [Xanthobacter sp. TB0136]|uniref:DUF485 domain-containing protein n=1 Tax=Xanthobacter sp. TB0136 TaxID=3459177 RepID=UPI0040395BA1